MSADEEMFDELLGAYALDAVDADERRGVEQYLQVSPRAAAEVQAHREVATLLAWTTMAPPEGLWDRIASSLDGEAPAPGGELARVIPMRQQPRGRFATAAIAWVAASAAAAVIAVVALQVLKDDSGPVSPLAAAAAEARSHRGSLSATLESADSSVQVAAVVDADGHGFLEAQELPSLPADRTYQLWGVIDGEAISLGVLGHSPEIEPFTAHGNLTALVITNEAAGGVITNGNPDGAFVGELG